MSANLRHATGSGHRADSCALLTWQSTYGCPRWSQNGTQCGRATLGQHRHDGAEHGESGESNERIFPYAIRVSGGF